MWWLGGVLLLLVRYHLNMIVIVNYRNRMTAHEYTLEKTEGAIKNGQSRGTKKQRHNTEN